MHHPRFSLLCTAALCGTAAAGAFANDGLDTSWNGTGTLVVQTPALDMQGGVGMALQPDGRILLGGTCRQTGNSTHATLCIARLLSNGVRDLSFGPNQTGVFPLSQLGYPFDSADADYAMSGSRGVLRQADGKIVLAGRTSPFADLYYPAVIRLLADGTLDLSVQHPVVFAFSYDNNQGAANGLIRAVAQQADGKIVVAGDSSRPPSTDIAIARLRTDLTLDPGFNGTGTRTIALDLSVDNSNSGSAIAIQRDGKIVVAGTVHTASTGIDSALVRLNADGSRDASFGNNGVAWFDLGAGMDDAIWAVRIDATGRIWLAGNRPYSMGITDSDFLIARVRADGSALDTDFCGTGYRTVAIDLGGTKNDVATDMLLQSDGKIVIAGYAATSAGNEFAVARVLPNCSLDPTFGNNGMLHGALSPTLPYSTPGAMSFGASGVVMAGYAANADQSNTVQGGQFGMAMIRLDLVFTDGFDTR